MGVKRVPFLIGYGGIAYVASWLEPKISFGTFTYIEPAILEFKLKFQKDRFLYNLKKGAYGALENFKKSI